MTLGITSTDVEQRIDFDAMRKYKLARLREQMDKDNLGAMLFFDTDNIRYATSTWLNDWAHDKMGRYCVIPREGEPVLFEGGSAKSRKKELCPWIKPENVRAARRWKRGSLVREALPAFGKAIIDDIKQVLQDNKVDKLPLGVDMGDMVFIEMLQQSGLKIVPGWPAMFDAREIKSPDELKLLEVSAALVDCVYQQVFDFIRPGVRENEVVAKVYGWLLEHGCNRITGMNCVSGPRSNPNSHDFSDRLIRPGDLVFMDIMSHYLGYSTCYYRTFAVTKATQKQRDVYKRCLQDLMAATDLIKPGVSTAEVAAAWPKAQDQGFKDEIDAQGTQSGHGIGLSIHEKPYIYRVLSLEHPTILQPGMCIAMETFYGEGQDGARIEIEVIVTETGKKIITQFPYEELVVCAPI